MAQNVTIAGASYPDVPSISVPKTGGGTADFLDTSDADAQASEILNGKTAYVKGAKVLGTGGAGVPSGGNSGDYLAKSSNTDFDMGWKSASTATPLMNGTATAGTSTDLSRADHVHPSDTSKQDTLVSGTNIKTVGGQSLLGSGNIDTGGALYFQSVACSAMTGNFATVSNAAITANHVVVSIVFANSSAITSDVTWTTASGSLTLNGTCASATTADIVLVLKNN